MKNLNPNSNPSLLMTEGIVNKILYMAGEPRNYRLDLSKGYLNLNGITAITKPKQEFQVIPIAIRTIEADLFKQGFKKWCEFYFINEQSQVCCFMFHEFSLDNFRQQFKELYYDETAPTDARWKIGFVEKQTNDADKNKYFIANFSYEMLTADEIAIQAELVAQIKKQAIYIFRHDTAQHPSTYKIGYSSHIEPDESDLRIEAKKHEEMIEKEFPIKEAKPKAAKQTRAKKEKATA